MAYNIEFIDEQYTTGFLLPQKDHRPLLKGPTDLTVMLDIVEDTTSNNDDDVIMRILTLEKLICQNQLDQTDSHALKIYAMDEDNLYGKPIQRAAMTELASRTQKARFKGN